MPEAGPAMLTGSLSADSVTGTHVVPVMGTVVSFNLRDHVPLDAFRNAVASLQAADRIFSTYQPDSEISRLQRGEIDVRDCHPDVVEVLQRCRVARERTDGYFTAHPYGELDPTGLVKGWAIQRASQILADAGSRWHAVNGGGDIQLVSAIKHDDWRVGITDPTDRSRIVAVAALRDGAIATSGTAERGDHIINPHTAEVAQHYLSVTITAPTLTDADVFATAAFAKGEGAVAWIEHVRGLEGLFVDRHGRVTTTSGFPSPAADPAFDSA
jgi:thiamine biosynthesis lipoprotein